MPMKYQDFQEDSRAHQQEHPRTVKGYVAGIGWCWIEDGEVIEVISQDD